MKNLKDFLTESNSSNHNIRLEHIEEEMFNLGISGLRQSINFLRSIKDMLNGHSKKSNVKLTVKWDGSPSLIVGNDPVSNKFFVGTKSVLNKTPKLNFTDDDIDRNHPEPNLNSKLKLALNELSKVGITGILQGDMMFTRDDLKTKIIGDKEYITFQPNTILYAIPIDSDIAKRILNSEMGIVFHTSYFGKSISELKSSFDVNVSSLRNKERVWIQDANYEDNAGTATMTEKESADMSAVLSKAGKLFHTMDASVVNTFAEDRELRTLIKQFNNNQVREGKDIINPNSHAKLFLKFLKEKFDKEIDKRKSEKGKLAQQDKLKSTIIKFEKSQSQLIIMFEMMVLMQQAKLMIIDKLKKIQQIGTFLPTSTGFKVTSPEGFVISDHLTGNAVKLVDRLEFSRANFNVAKNWAN